MILATCTNIHFSKNNTSLEFSVINNAGLISEVSGEIATENAEN